MTSPRISFNRPAQNSTYHPTYLQNNAAPVNRQPASLLVSTTAPISSFQQQPAVVAVDRSSIVEEIPRPQYEKTYNTIPANKRLAPENDPQARQTCCTPCCWVFVAVIGLAALTLALLYGLNVIAPSTSSQVVASSTKGSTTVPTAPTATTTTTTPSASASNTAATAHATTSPSASATHQQAESSNIPEGTTTVSKSPTLQKTDSDQS